MTKSKVSIVWNTTIPGHNPIRVPIPCWTEKDSFIAVHKTCVRGPIDEEPVLKSRGDWTVSHKLTGCSILKHIPSLKLAKTIHEEIKGWDWNFYTEGSYKIKRLSEPMKALCTKHNV